MFYVYKRDDGVIAINGQFQDGDTYTTTFEEVHSGGEWLGHSFETLQDGRYDLEGKRVGDLVED